MRLLEYQGKELFAKAGIPVPPGRVAATVEEAVQIMRDNPVPSAVKAQVLIGGRGKAGGIKFATNGDDVKEPAKAILGMNIKGEIAKRVLIEQRMDIEKELYVSITVDRASKRPIVIASAMGGMDIEEVAATNPSAIAKYAINPAAGYWPFVGRRVAADAKIPARAVAQFVDILGRLYTLFFDVGAMLLEINPLAITKDGKLVASDAKVDIDDNGLIRHPQFDAWRTDLPDDPLEQRARQTKLNYAYLSGKGNESVGVIGNGAGLVMATMDAVRAAGGEATDFCDIGGGARADVVRNAVDIVTADPRVKVLFMNIFGGITRGDEVAQGLIAALDGGGWKKDRLVVRLTGTNEREGRAVLEEAGITAVETMNEGAARAVALAKSIPTA
jgi:succinyl-CoA synthetase beta subunit